MSDVITTEYTEEGQVLRKIRSFVRREGRLTKGQETALAECWPSMGLDYQTSTIDWSAVFGNNNPVVLEIGFGMGASLVEMASKSPEKNFIGIEVHTPGVGACLSAAKELGLTNLKVMCHDAVEVFEKMIPDASLSCIQLFFPDPWHKKRHHKRRIVQADFVEMVRAKLLVNEGVFHMATDWENYAEHMIEIMKQAPKYQTLASEGDYIERPEDRPLTKFEQRGHRLGHGVWDIKYRRIS